MTTHSNNIQTVLGILEDERHGRVAQALQKLTPDYCMTWVYQTKSGALFPKSKTDITTEVEKVYAIKGREYDIKNITENNTVVMVELVESYPDQETGKVYRTPLVLVLELVDGKIKKGRHYCDPHVSSLYLTKEKVAAIFE
jgi:hypothetical protein